MVVRLLFITNLCDRIGWMARMEGKGRAFCRVRRGYAGIPGLATRAHRLGISSRWGVVRTGVPVPPHAAA